MHCSHLAVAGGDILYKGKLSMEKEVRIGLQKELELTLFKSIQDKAAKNLHKKVEEVAEVEGKGYVQCRLCEKGGLKTKETHEVMSKQLMSME